MSEIKESTSFTSSGAIQVSILGSTPGKCYIDNLLCNKNGIVAFGCRKDFGKTVAFYIDKSLLSARTISSQEFQNFEKMVMLEFNRMWDGYMLSESTKTECFENQFCDGNHLHFFSEPKRSGWSIQLAVDSSDNFTINVVKSDLEYLARLIAPTQLVTPTGLAIRNCTVEVFSSELNKFVPYNHKVNQVAVIKETKTSDSFTVVERKKTAKTTATPPVSADYSKLVEATTSKMTQEPVLEPVQVVQPVQEQPVQVVQQVLEPVQVVQPVEVVEPVEVVQNKPDPLILDIAETIREKCSASNKLEFITMLYLNNNESTRKISFTTLQKMEAIYNIIQKPQDQVNDELKLKMIGKLIISYDSSTVA
jgi:hypothetical protein